MLLDNVYPAQFGYIYLIFTINSTFVYMYVDYLIYPFGFQRTSFLLD